MDKKSAFQGLAILSALSILIAAADYFANIALFNLGADSWMLVGIGLGVWAQIVRK